MPELPILDWALLAGECWDNLLVGNGASIAVWEPFGYGTLRRAGRAFAA